MSSVRKYKTIHHSLVYIFLGWIVSFHMSAIHYAPVGSTTFLYTLRSCRRTHRIDFVRSLSDSLKYFRAALSCISNFCVFVNEELNYAAEQSQSLSRKSTP